MRIQQQEEELRARKEQLEKDRVRLDEEAAQHQQASIHVTAIV